MAEEQEAPELREEIDQLKRQVGEVDHLKRQMEEMMALLRNMENRQNAEGNPLTSRNGNPATPDYPSGYIPVLTLNPQGAAAVYSTRPPVTMLVDAHAARYPYGLPQGYTPPFETVETQAVRTAYAYGFPGNGPYQTPYHQAPYRPYYPPPPQNPYPYPYVAATSPAPYQQMPRPMTPQIRPPHPNTNPPQRPFRPLAQNPTPNTNHPRPSQKRKPVHFDPIPMSYTQLLPQLISGSLLLPVPMKPVEPPYPRGYDPNARCDYHAGAIGHSTENCRALKFKVQDLIDAKWLSFKDTTPNVGHNPLPNHGSSG